MPKISLSSFSTTFKVVALLMLVLFVVNCVNDSDNYSQSPSSTKTPAASATSPLWLPLITKNHLEYAGGFRIPNTTFGESRVASSQGGIGLTANKDSIYMASHVRDHAIGEFSMPTLVNSHDVALFNMAFNIQPFSEVLERGETGNPQKINRIGGMAFIDGSLVVNAYEYYDAPADNTHTTLVLHEPDNLASSTVSGFDGYDAKAHAAGWLSEIPPEWQGYLNGTYITGDSAGRPINGRNSLGPTAFSFYPESTITFPHLPTTVATTPLFDYSLAYPLGYTSGNKQDYLRNIDHTNKLWTHLSRATYGFIVPSTRSYFTIGFSGGHDSGIGYKITQDDGTLCGGYCSYEAADNYGYYWIFDLNDLSRVASGQIERHEILPYEFGKFVVPTNSSGYKKIMGGTFDSESKTLYLVVDDGDMLQGMEGAPLIVAYKVHID